MIDYYLLTKPGIIAGNLITVAAGFALGSQGKLNIALLLITLLGLGLVIASACAFNNYIDRNIDGKMERTKQRAVARGAIAGRSALFFASFLGISGALFLCAFTNLLTLVVAAFGFFVYVCLYTPWKSRSVYSTAIGSVAGAVPPVVGYCSASGQFDLAAFLLFAMMVFWQMPHFFAIALFHLNDYAKARIPVLPLVRGVRRTKIHMILYIPLFIAVSALLTFFHYTGIAFLGAVLFLGAIWFGISLKGFTCHNDEEWGKQMFRFSLVMISAVCLLIPFDRALSL